MKGGIEVPTDKAVVGNVGFYFSPRGIFQILNKRSQIVSTDTGVENVGMT